MLSIVKGEKLARYQGGLLDFSYRASLHISHPKKDLSYLSEALGMTPERITLAGEPKRTPVGNPLEGYYDFSHWFATLDTLDGVDLAGFLRNIVLTLSEHRTLLRELADDGGEIECFIGISAHRLCDQVLQSDLLSELGDLNVNLRLDYYKQKLPTE